MHAIACVSRIEALVVNEVVAGSVARISRSMLPE